MKKKKNTKLGQYQDIASQGGVCEECKRSVRRLSVDHIIPQNILLCFDDGPSIAYEWEENFRYICQPCNHLKGGKLDMTNQRTAQLMHELIKPYL